MTLTSCPECGTQISEKAGACPQCGAPLRLYRGFEWKTRMQILGLPLIHVAAGRDRKTGKLLVAKGIIAVGQFGYGLITIAQFGVGFLFAIGQCVVGAVAIGQVAIGISFGLGQLATGLTAIGQIAIGRHVLCQAGLGKFVWSARTQDPEAVKYFTDLWHSAKGLMGL